MASRATSPGMSGFKWISSFSSAEKEAKRHRDTCGCVPDPATLFGVSEKINACFLIVWKGVCFMYVIFFFQAKKKEAKKSLGHLRLCPKPRNALLVWEKINACFLTVGTDVLGCPLSSFFKRRKKKQKSRRDTCDCVPDPATLFWCVQWLAASRPQCFKVSVKLRCVAPATPFLERIEKNNNLIS